MTEQIFNLRVLREKYLQHQQPQYHGFMDFKIAFDQVWHDALWTMLKRYNINTRIIEVIQCLYDKTTSTVYYNGHISEWFQTTVGI